MPKKTELSKQRLMQAALSILRKAGGGAISARTIAGELHCSTQPIFSQYLTMQDLCSDVRETVYCLYVSYRAQDMARHSDNPYLACLRSHLRFAYQEPKLFFYLYLEAPNDYFAKEQKLLCSLLQKMLGVSPSDAEQLHTQLWSLCHGMAVLHVTQGAVKDFESAVELLSHQYQSIT